MKKAQVITRIMDKAKAFDGWEFDAFGETFPVYKHGKEWYVIERNTGLSVCSGRTRKQAVGNLTEELYNKVVALREKPAYVKTADKFAALMADAGFVVDEPAPTLVAETSVCFWYDGEVEGAKLATKGKHAGMWWVRKVAVA